MNQRPARMMPHGGVERGRSHGGELDAMGMMDGDGADEKGAKSVGEELVDQSDTAGF